MNYYIWKVFNSPDEIKINENVLTDIFDGEIYAKFRQEENRLNHYNQSFTFSIFTDGISVCKKSMKTIWPIFLVINEIPIEYRFAIENVVVAGELFP